MEILKEKAAQGVDVRVMYDDVGCIMTLPYKYNEKLESMGIKCCVFNPLFPSCPLSSTTGITGKSVSTAGWGFTGGINLADEYINAYVKTRPLEGLCHPPQRRRCEA